MRNKNLIYGAVFVFLVFVSIAVFQVASAATTPCEQTPGGCTGFEKICDSDKGIAVCVQQIYVLALGLGALVALLMIVLAGYRYMTAQGNAQQVEGAKEAFASAFIGLIVIFVAFILLYLINPDLVKFRGLNFPSSSTSNSGPPPGSPLTGEQEEVMTNLKSLLQDYNLTLDSTTGAITGTNPQGKKFTLIPDPTSSLPFTISQTLQAYGLDPSKVSITEYNVSDPSLIPDSLAALMGGKRPSRILIVTGSGTP